MHPQTGIKCASPHARLPAFLQVQGCYPNGHACAMEGLSGGGNTAPDGPAITACLHAAAAWRPPAHGSAGVGRQSGVSIPVACWYMHVRLCMSDNLTVHDIKLLHFQLLAAFWLDAEDESPCLLSREGV